MIKHITFATDDMSISSEKCTKSALAFGCDESMIYNSGFYTKEFYHFNQNILDQKRGAGYWLWKPYFIYQELLNLPEGDTLIYTDAGLLFQNHIKHLINGMGNDQVMLFDNRWVHGDWCKRDVFINMACDESYFHEHKQLQASCIILRRTPFTLGFIKQWLMWCQMPGMIDDTPSIEPNLPGFREHRHDQAILTNLALIYGLKFHWWSVQYCVKYRNEHPDDKYPLIFYHHRYRNHEWQIKN